MAYYITRIQEC